VPAKIKAMNSLLQTVLSFILAMTLLLWMIPNRKIKAISGFFAVVLPRIPFTAILRSLHETSKKKNKKAA